MCSKIDFLGEAENMFEELKKFNDGIHQGLEIFKTREEYIMHIIKKLSKKDGPLY